MNTETNILVTVVKQACQGESNAQALLYGQFGKAMFNTCLRITANRHDAEDLLQESFVIAFRNLKQLKQEQNFGGWLRKIVINECMRYGRKKIRWRELEEGHAEHSEPDDPAWFADVSIEHLNEGIRALPDACRMVFTLYAIEDYSHREIAGSLNISESTSRSQYHRARQLLMKRILKITING